ncbi:hypothetical protein [Lachnotalea glycerini]|uniref:Uncharacterized protein n=1 Tax=Lachnotalea glycerini TaxID=1763509 RepID=A0A371JH17_9FIRM|nr:hypothetical protein [Lachnotalea glycerini]RDY32024.1 hypothetical protein CG710_006915 [Lachnotalea glycerini]
MSAEKRKQDCETKAFVRLIEKIKKRLHRLPIVFLADSLYSSVTIMNICKKNCWDFIIRNKAGSISSITEEYEAIPEKETVCPCRVCINDIDYKENTVNMLRF